MPKLQTLPTSIPSKPYKKIILLQQPPKSQIPSLNPTFQTHQSNSKTPKLHPKSKPSPFNSHNTQSPSNLPTATSWSKLKTKPQDNASSLHSSTLTSQNKSKPSSKALKKCGPSSSLHRIAFSSKTHNFISKSFLEKSKNESTFPSVNIIAPITSTLINFKGSCPNTKILPNNLPLILNSKRVSAVALKWRKKLQLKIKVWTRKRKRK